MQLQCGAVYPSVCIKIVRAAPWYPNHSFLRYFHTSNRGRSLSKLLCCSAGAGRAIYLFCLGLFTFSPLTYKFQLSSTVLLVVNGAIGKFLTITTNMEPNKSMPFGGTDILTQFMTRPLEYLLMTTIFLAIPYILTHYSRSNLNDYPVVNASRKGLLSGRIGTRVSLTNPRLVLANIC